MREAARCAGEQQQQQQQQLQPAPPVQAPCPAGGGPPVGGAYPPPRRPTGPALQALPPLPRGIAMQARMQVCGGERSSRTAGKAQGGWAGRAVAPATAPPTQPLPSRLFSPHSAQKYAQSSVLASATAAAVAGAAAPSPAASTAAAAAGAAAAEGLLAVAVAVALPPPLEPRVCRSASSSHQHRSSSSCRRLGWTGSGERSCVCANKVGATDRAPAYARGSDARLRLPPSPTSNLPALTDTRPPVPPSRRRRSAAGWRGAGPRAP